MGMVSGMKKVRIGNNGENGVAENDRGGADEEDRL
jgi:hypothetical protein